MLHIYIVSLKQDIERRKVISKALEIFGLKFSFIDAVYGKELSEEVVSSIRSISTGKVIDRGYALTPGEIGCTLSHLMAYQDILDNDVEWACILEDDVFLDKRFKIFINTFQATELNLESLYLLGGQNGLDEAQIIKSIKNIKNVGGQEFSKAIKSEQFVKRTCCYLISSVLAENLIKLSQTNFILADDWNYLVKNNVIKKIYLSEFVDHPLDLSKSHLQEERELAASKRYSGPTHGKSSFAVKVKSTLNPRLRLLALRFYRYIENKEAI